MTVTAKTLRTVGHKVEGNQKYERVDFVVDGEVVYSATNGQQLQQRAGYYLGATLVPVPAQQSEPK